MGPAMYIGSGEDLQSRIAERGWRELVAGKVLGVAGRGTGESVGEEREGRGAGAEGNGLCFDHMRVRIRLFRDSCHAQLSQLQGLWCIQRSLRGTWVPDHSRALLWSPPPDRRLGCSKRSGVRYSVGIASRSASGMICEVGLILAD